MVVATNSLGALSGRRVERDILARLTTSGRAEFLAVYGRRRVGKTYLIRRFFAGEPVVFFEMVGRFDSSRKDQLRIFTESLGEAFHVGADLAVPADWHQALQNLRGAIEAQRGRRKKMKKVLFFDELPWIATHRSGFLRELEHFWNAWCSKRSDILLIVCGSAASWMLDKLVNARGGLYNRLTQTIRLLPFTLPEVEAYFHERRVPLTRSQIVELYMTFGGVPHYLDRVDRGLSVAEVIDRLCLAKDGAFSRELERVFGSLFASDGHYLDVIRALSKRRRGLTRNELLAAIDIPSGGAASTILRNLEEAGFIGTTVPFGRTSRDRYYRLTDELSLFHTRWLEGRRPKSWQAVRKTPAWYAWAGLAFESLCLGHVAAIERALGISGVRTEVSGWRHPEAQIDVVIDRADDVVTLCEVKHSDEPFTITKKYAEELRHKMAVFRRDTGTRKGLQLVFVTRHGLLDNHHSRELVDRTLTADDLFG